MDTNENYNLETVRTAQLNELLPPYIKDGQGKRLLYVGGHLRYGRNLQMTDYFLKCGYKIDVIEVFPDNVRQLREVKWISALYEADIRLFHPLVHYDVVVFWHGPEHLKRAEVKELFSRMKTYSDAVIFATPNGVYEQGREYGNPHEAHLSIWLEGDFIIMNMLTSSIGDANKRNGNIIAYWDKLMGYE